MKFVLSSLRTVVFSFVLLGLVAVGKPAKAQLTGAGATFPAPLYQRWFQEYAQAGGPTINYQAIGSGGGIKNISAHSVDFGASDAPMSAAELAAAPGILHIPTVAGAVAIGYNLPGVRPGLKLTGSLIADIFLGKVTKWNDPQIVKLNPGIVLPNLPIYPIHRSDGSGTTNAFTTYLTEISADWKAGPGAGKSVRWLKGLGGKGTSGVAALVKQNAGGVGYIELNYAIQNHIACAAVQNAKGKFILPTVQSTTEAAAGSVLPPDFRKVIVNTSAATGYPIASFTYLLFYPNAKPELKKFLQWSLTTGQKDAASLYYAPLPEGIRQRALKAVAAIH